MSETKTQTISGLAGEAYGYFETRKRGDEPDAERFVSLKDERPDWLQELVFEAHGHGDYLPDDWRYQTIRDAIGHIHDSGAESADDLEDSAHEFADQNVDVYTGSRYAWLASNLRRSGYVDEARDEGLIGPDADVAEQIGVGQYEESREVFASVLQSLAERLDS